MTGNPALPTAGRGWTLADRDWATNRSDNEDSHAFGLVIDEAVIGSVTATLATADWGTSENNRKAKFYSITKSGLKSDSMSSTVTCSTQAACCAGIRLSRAQLC